MKFLYFFISLVFFTTSLFASSIEQSLNEYFQGMFKKNSRLILKDFRVLQTQELKNFEGWNTHFIKFTLEDKILHTKIVAGDVMFSNGDFFTKELISLNTKQDIKSSLYPSVKDEYYKPNNLLFGNKDAKYKLILFSDFECPFCMDFVPDLINDIKKYPKDIALYYYHFPLNFHPHSRVISKLTILALKNGYSKDLIQKVYETDFDDVGIAPEEILSFFNKQFKTKITLKDLESKELEDELYQDLDMGANMVINSTPTLYINGVRTNNYKSILKKLENK
jgi:protein-disulfide isomerase